MDCSSENWEMVETIHYSESMDKLALPFYYYCSIIIRTFPRNFFPIFQQSSSN